jgi:integrase
MSMKTVVARANVVDQLSINQDQIYDKKLFQVTADLQPYKISLLKRMGQINSQFIIEFLYSKMREGNLKPASRASSIDRLCQLSLYHNNKSFKDITQEDIFTYLDTLRKTEGEDPLHKWIGTYNISVIKIISFFRWLYQSDLHSNDRSTPEFLNNLRCIKRKEKTTYSAEMLWTPEEDSLFLKYCPDKRLRLYHIMARETSGRPHELLNLKIGDVIWHNSDGRVYATITIGKEGKTTARTVPIISSVPYYKDWISEHPFGESKNHFLFLSLNRRSKMRNKKLDTHSLNVLYSNMKHKLLPRLLEDPNIPHADKEKLKDLLRKPINPYLRRHIGISERARQIPEHSLRLFSGWTKTSRMPEVYTHELGDEVSNQILELEGITTRSSKQADILRPKICSNCSEPNKPDAKFCSCSTCHMILSHESYTDTIETLQEKTDAFLQLADTVQQLSKEIQELKKQQK